MEDGNSGPNNELALVKLNLVRVHLCPFGVLFMI